jgi:ABC-2 type transport system ATP-binding protein
MLAVDARDLVKTFRSGWFGRHRTTALRGASLEVPRGAIFGLLGPNGAGKTTLLSILATLLLPDGGSATVLGHDVVREPFAVRRRLNMASGNASFVWSLRPAEVLTFYGRLYGLSGRALRARVDELIDLCELGAHRRTEYTALSTGLKQRLAFAKALLNEPEVLLLDEPTASLDPDIGDRMRTHLEQYQRASRCTMLLASHNMGEVERMCDDVIMLRAGAVVDQGSPADLVARYGRADMEEVFLDIARGDGQAPPGAEAESIAP